MAQDMVYLGESTIGTVFKSVFCYFVVECSTHVLIRSR